MFEVGKNYEFHIIENGDEVTFWGTVESYNHPLIKLADKPPMSVETIENDDGTVSILFEEKDGKGSPGRIINVTAPNFISALEKEESSSTAASAFQTRVG